MMKISRRINPLYLKKLEKIQKQKGIRFESVEEFEAYFSDRSTNTQVMVLFFSKSKVID